MSLSKEKFSLDNLVGQVYGSSFRVENGALIKMTLHEINSLSLSDDTKEGEDKDLLSNRELLDDRENQKMGRDEIADLKEQGMSGELIVEQLVKNSSTFCDKTEFSKQKYIKRKSKKHIVTFSLLACNTRNLLDMYFNKGPTKICNLRMESLAQVLNGGNVRAGGRFVVVDGCSGLLTGAVLERLDGNGLVVNMYSGSAPARPAVELGYNFSDSQLSILKDFPLTHLSILSSIVAALSPRLQQKIKEQQLQQQQKHHSTQQQLNPVDCDNEIETSSQQQPSQPTNHQLPQEHISAPIQDEEISHSNTTKNKEEGYISRKRFVPSSKRGKRKPETLEERNARRIIKRDERNDMKKIIEEDKMDGILICTRASMSNLTIALLPLLKSGRPIVVFSQYREPLIECYRALKKCKQALMLKMSETWLRQYQILENRSHPLVNMSGSGGFILTAIKVQEK